MNSLPRSPQPHAPEQLVNDPAVVADSHSLYERWRQAGPVHRASTPDGLQVWVVTRYGDVRAGLADPRLSLSKSRARPDGYRGFSLPLMDGLTAGEPLPGAALEELIRFADPNRYAIRRFATEDLNIGGVRIPAGDTVLLCLASANRDPARFADPGALDLTRTGNPHLSFGVGIHYCLGAPLARIETGIAISSLLRRLPGLTLAVKPDELRWRPSFRSRGLLELPVTWPAP